jgi:hypothetical protein
LSASAYVDLPGMQAEDSGEYFQPRTEATASGSLAVHNDAEVMTSMRLVELKNSRDCDSGHVVYQSQYHGGSGHQDRLDDCVALQVKTREDAVVFFLNHQPNNGLVRLSGRECYIRTQVRIARANETLRYPVPLHTMARNSASPATAWQLNPDAEIYYAIAVSNSQAARALSRHLDQLPRRCTASVRAGLEGMYLENWLMKLAVAVDQWQPHVDWQGIRVRNVF